MSDVETARPVTSTTTSSNGDFHWWQLRPPRRLPRTRILAMGVIVIVVLSAIAYGAYLWHFSQTHISTDDAFIAGHISPVSARVNGTVIEVLAIDNQDVKSGGVLVRLDPRDYEVAVAQARASVEAAQGELQNAVTNVPLADETTKSLLREADAALAGAVHGREIAEHDLEQRQSDLRGKQAVVAGAEATVRGAEADFERAKLDRDRIAELFRTQLVARQDLDHAEATFKNTEAMLEVARHKLTEARDGAAQAAAAVQSQTAAIAQARQRIAQSDAALSTAQGNRQQVKVREAAVEAARGRLQLAIAALQQAQLNLDYTTIRAPFDGRVSKKTVEVGQVVQTGQSLLSVVSLDDVWVIANFKETQLTEVRRGQAATIVVDTYPDVVFKARVDSIQGGSGAVFSLLPPENATGNYVKVVQRIPVKLVLAPGENARHVLVPGMSVVPTIALR
ncbi:MAG TPA: HlyD family secretion protein [Candidatus Methylomirabilis sp.]|nr:HlyD family secretion protein [Candidatus Methylomirabilis sp.]